MTDFPRATIFSKAFQRPWWTIHLHVFIYWSFPSFSRSLKAMHQTDLLSLHRVRPPLCLTSLINRWPVWEWGLRPCHSPVRLIGFHLSLQSKGSDYKQINRGVGAGSAGPPPCAPTLTAEEIESVWKWSGWKEKHSLKASLFTAVLRQGWWR